MVPLEAVQALRTRPAAPLHRIGVPEIAVLRVDAAPPPDPSRRPTGFAANLSPTLLRESLHGWWRCDAASVAAGGVLPVTVSGYVVAIMTGLDRWEKDEQGRHGFPDAVLAGYVTDLAQPITHLTTPDPRDRELADLLLGTRLASHSGGTIAYVTTTPAPAPHQPPREP
jgi:hypothetical protein